MRQPSSRFASCSLGCGRDLRWLQLALLSPPEAAPGQSWAWGPSAGGARTVLPSRRPSWQLAQLMEGGAGPWPGGKRCWVSGALL